MDKKVKKKNVKDLFKKIGAIILSMGIGAIIGIFVCKLIEEVVGDYGPFTIIIGMAIFVFAFMLQLILHEVGHLICGLWSGYEFVSFRIGTLTFVKDNGKIVTKKFTIKGTAGQCIMMPPKDKKHDCPYILYNLGGILMNAVITCLCIAIYLWCPMPKILSIFFIFTAISGVYDLILNGIPMKISGVCNDAYNLLSIKRDKIAKYSFYIALRVNGLLYEGVRIKDMPLEWFELPEGADLGNPIISSIEILKGNYYFDKKEFHKAKECYEKLLNNVPNLIKLYENEIKCELLFLEIIGDARKDIIDKLYTKELKSYIRATDCYMSRKRLMYAYALIIEQNTQKADKLLNEAYIAQKTCPAKGDAESEMEIIEFVKETYAQ
ncbi:hypothetical protein [Haloimpatiens lingqiaonensis]|uniref:hypothetical protein n=1 Tax=Haloimpatiens lingqiaonensis TaxID=1380675 RepID=UPI0010FDB107|nr:hypothetical protein [Haloimpatiens lingqiaonensis]